ncbi:hypothetical protein C1Y63_08010 [Corynebacterium sp. 13CS0277]|uniref:hypothetical protein n=1 Tax=Corynebacterium sp. 13CS0277 TaxID=2071994 RepID=UPI000D045BC2|nr:hypothetical protein [Corynebacterium sp. 13CS0277]PRQ11065.1 hypothetical protein C1Y63_08010 [Corynebacterium sp. 13CS0277]
MPALPPLPQIPQQLLALVGGLVGVIALVAALATGGAGSSASSDAEPPKKDGVHVVVTNTLGMPAKGCAVTASWDTREVARYTNSDGIYTFDNPGAGETGEQKITVECNGLFSGKRTVSIPLPTESRTVVPVKM